MAPIFVVPTKYIDPCVLEFVVWNTAWNNQGKRCISLNFNFNRDFYCLNFLFRQVVPIFFKTISMRSITLCFSEVRVALSLVFCIVYCRIVLIFSFLFLWSLYCLSFNICKCESSLNRTLDEPESCLNWKSVCLKIC